MSTVNRKKDIAVIGMSGVFPKSDNLTDFWENLINGVELSQHLKEDEFDPELSASPNYIPVSSFINKAESFDYKFFGYTKEEAALMDPQIRVMHEQVYTALDNAGYTHELDKQNIGLYLAASDNFNWRLLELFYNSGKVSKFLARRLSNKEFISTLISYKLGLKGPSYYTDTACSASLCNVHLASRSLLLRECNMAVAGGVRILSTSHKGYLFEEGLINSKDGRCRAFDEKSSGTIWGEGAGVVVLKRFEDAVKDKDYIYAVIKATAVNNDANRKVGYTAPSVEGQSDCIKMAHRIAGVTADSIGYVEAHGTGTKLGDPIEIEALNKAFNYDKKHKCAIGSVKTNMGHLDTAAGISGFIKTCLSLDTKMLPPSLHFDQPNPEINFKGGPFYVNTELQKWKSENIRRAGVSSFGIGGTNCHVVLEEYESVLQANNNPTTNFLILSAKTRNALTNYKNSLASFLEKNEDLNIHQFAFSVNQKARSFGYRDFILFENKESALEQLKLNDTIAPTKNFDNIIFLFPGQGTQYYEMAADLYRELPVFRDLLNQGFAQLEELSGIDFKEIIGFKKSDKIKPETINNTLYTQPLLFMIEVALAKTMMALGIKPDAMIGHSLGEYAAACIANVFSFTDGIKIIYHRALLMNNMEAGSMIAVKTNLENIKSFLPQNLSVATINTKDTCVLSGTKEAVIALSEKLDAEELAYTILKTSHAFHSSMMDDMLEPFEKVLKTIEFATPEIPLASNLTGQFLKADEVNPTYWPSQLRNTVLFQKGLENLLTKYPASESVFIEVGPGRVLLNFLKKQTTQAPLSISLLRSAKEQKDDYNYFLKNLRTLWRSGYTLQSKILYTDSISKIPVPSYVFDVTNLPARVSPSHFMQGKFTASNNLDTLLSNLSTDSLFSVAENNKTEHTDQQADDFRVNLSTAYKAPLNDIQKHLCDIWASFLGEEKIGIEDDFFELGGDSLKAMSILNTIKKEFNCEIEIQDLYDSPTIKTVSTKIAVLNKLKNINKKVSHKNTIKI